MPKVKLILHSGKFNKKWYGVETLHFDSEEGMQSYLTRAINPDHIMRPCTIETMGDEGLLSATISLNLIPR